MTNKIEGYLYEYPRPAVAATVVVFSTMGTILLGLRKKDASAYPDMWCSPGGFLDEGKETCRQAAVRELDEEMNLDVDPDDLILFDETSSPDTDPRCHVVNQCYYVVITNDQAATIKAGDDIVDHTWVYTSKVPELAFNHNGIVDKAIQRYQDDLLFAKLLKERGVPDFEELEASERRNRNPQIVLGADGQLGTE